MSTVDRAVALKIIAGEYADDLPTRIVRYRNAFNGEYAYGVTFGGQDKNTYAYPTDFIRCPEIVWDANTSYVKEI